ncbi:PcfJ domain-containing protein [Kaistia dalseonensis]|uniref:Uncharacterized protein n=1 Tax=Kaistia dalseonensis TaxID=410840 RepID=A0ABU0H7V7_9HYPH|nr:PcfJ domain-containing protein [Kaistia dalseonensis]MCX5495793.1 PcfJ domain-containing protein [Kaistia dalseonensis]MDQ0438394.1 hypothetical protein [Kaistia dalseonensis]
MAEAGEDRHGGVCDGWAISARDRAYCLFADRRISLLARRVAVTERYAIDQLEQAPAIMAFLVMSGRINEWVFLEKDYREAAAKGRKLPRLMAALGATYPLRRIHAWNVRFATCRVIVRLAACRATVVAQAMPLDTDLQLAWLHTLNRWQELSDEWWGWAVARLGEAFRTIGGQGLDGHERLDRIRAIEGDSDALFEWVVAGNARLDQRWSLERASSHLAAWRKALEREMGATASTPVDYGPLPLESEVDGYRFIALRTQYALHAEGRDMNHCVASYYPKVEAGLSRIYSMRLDNRAIATLEIGPDFGGTYHIVQIRGPGNGQPAPEVDVAVRAFLNRINAAAFQSATAWIDKRRMTATEAFRSARREAIDYRQREHALLSQMTLHFRMEEVNVRLLELMRRNVAAEFDEFARDIILGAPHRGVDP